LTGRAAHVRQFTERDAGSSNPAARAAFSDLHRTTPIGLTRPGLNLSCVFALKLNALGKFCDEPLYALFNSRLSTLLGIMKTVGLKLTVEMARPVH
jgi:hypothetical protein